TASNVNWPRAVGDSVTPAKTASSSTATIESWGWRASWEARRVRSAPTPPTYSSRRPTSNRFERGVDPHLALRAAARFVEILTQSVPELSWLSNPLDVWGDVPTPPTISLRAADVERLLGVPIARDEVTTLLTGLGFTVKKKKQHLKVTAPSRRLDVREGALGRADVIEEIARLYSYRRL